MAVASKGKIFVEGYLKDFNAKRRDKKLKVELLAERESKIEVFRYGY